MIEEVLQFGEQNRLVGVITRPSKNYHKTGFILLNSGLLSKSGAFRFSVDLSRQLTNLNFTTFRFDFGGIGDSETGLSSETFIERSSQEIQLAIQQLKEKYELDNFIVGGLCSAADCALLLDAYDDNIKGLLLIDPPAYRTKRYFKIHKLKRVLRTLHSLDIMRWLKLINKFSSPITKTSELNFRVFPSRETMANNLNQHLLNAHLLFIVYTGGSLSYFNHKNQFYDMFPETNLDKNLKLHYLPKSDHLSILKRDRDKLIDLICDWAKNDVLRTN